MHLFHCWYNTNFNVEFLKGKVLSEFYVKWLISYEDSIQRVYKLNKSLIGLKESPCV